MAINIIFPLEDDVFDNFCVKRSKTTKDALRSKLLLLLLTDKGERYYLPDFGTNLNRYIFEPQVTETLQLIETEIKNSVKKYIPELTVKKVDFYQLEDEDGQLINENELRIEIKFNYSSDILSEDDTVIISKTI